MTLAYELGVMVRLFIDTAESGGSEMIFIERKDTADPATLALAERFHTAEVIALNQRSAWPAPAPNHDAELMGYAATMRECSLRLKLYGATPADLAELVTLFAGTVAERLSHGFDPVRDKDSTATWDLWREHGRLNACRTVLEILNAA